MNTSTTEVKEPMDVLYRLKRGLAGYVTYLAACDMNQAFSEYVLYEPILRILTARGYTVKCEYECPGTERNGPGDKKRLDFYATGHSVILGIEVKWQSQKSRRSKKISQSFGHFMQLNQKCIPYFSFLAKRATLMNWTSTSRSFMSAANLGSRISARHDLDAESFD